LGAIGVSLDFVDADIVFAISSISELSHGCVSECRYFL
jgi:hypothetical protein